MRLCAGTCGREVVRPDVWATFSPHDRELLRPVQARLVGRGLCSACHAAAVRSGTLADYPADHDGIPAEVVRQEWEHLADPHASVTANVRNLAPRLGMSEAALRNAYYKRVRPVFEAVA